MKKDYPFNLHFLLPFLLLFLMGIPFVGSGQNFNPSGLLGENINNPTSLDFGPNGRLYVSQQDGTIWEFIVERDMADPGSGSYSVVGTVAINDIKNGVPNHNDDGTVNTTNTRQVTGILASGTIATPVLYVSSSDSRIGGGGTGNETNLDTNSGVLSRLTWTGTGWDKVDLVRGLPRCEENHSTNGMDLFQQGGNTYLLLQQGGNTNRGAPSNNFAGTSEVFLSGAMLIINLTQLEGMGISTDPRNGAKFIYDLPTLNDPERADIDNTDPAFPYASGHPMFNATIDLGDPFGGNDGLNQAFPEPGGPVQIFSPGYRNAYDVVVTEDGRIYTGDNGPNSGWGGVPVIYTSDGSIKPNQSSYNPLMGDYITNDFNEANANEHGDALHYVGTTTDINGTYFGGHPVPIRAFPSLARVKTHELLVIGQNPQGEDITDWVETADHDFMDLLVGVSGYFATSFSAIDFPNDDRQGEYLADAINSPKVNILDIVNSSTNGICEYKTDNFDGALQGNILTASFNGMINRYELDATGTVLLAKDNGFLGGFGSQPLDVIALSDEDPFPGTIWA
ncbi:MAG: PKD domain-containing protein, partial [Bacteroidota bacterium]